MKNLEALYGKVTDYLKYGDGWVRRENISPKDIDVCNGEATDDSDTRTCALCVALNRTVFKNDNKPDYTHPYCKCEQIPTAPPEPTLDFPMRKITDYLFVKKRGLMYSMGYSEEDAKEVYQMIATNAKEQFKQGKYFLNALDNHGQKVNILLAFPGKREKEGHVYWIKTGWTVYPNGKLHQNTPFGGWAK